MKYALVTGAAGGLGLATAEHLTKKGWTIFACDINEEGLKSIKNEKIIPILMDITKEESIKKSFEYVRSKTVKLDSILNFAGINFMASLIEGDLSKIEKLIDINLLGMIKVNKIFFPLINESKGRIINISSECGWLGAPPFNGPYAISKYGVEAYNDSLRRELNFLGIKVINLQLGSFKTKMHEDTRVSFKALAEESKLYKKTLSKMGAMMDREMENANDVKYLFNAIDKCLELKNPKICYRIKNSRQLTMLNMFPESIVDKIYLKNLS